MLLLPARFQFRHDAREQFRTEQLAENHFFVIGRRPQQLHELALGDHRDLHELALGQPHDVRKLLIRLINFSVKNGPIRQRQCNNLFYINLAFRPGPLRRTLKVRRPVHSVNLLFAARQLGKRQLHKRLQRCLQPIAVRFFLFCLFGNRHILARQFSAVFLIVRGTRFPVQGKDNGVENRGLARAGIARNQKEIAVRPGKINFCFFAVGAKGLHRQLDWSHASPSPLCAALTASRKIAFSSSSKSFRNALHSANGSSVSSGTGCAE